MVLFSCLKFHPWLEAAEECLEVTAGLILLHPLTFVSQVIIGIVAYFNPPPGAYNL